MNIRDSQQAAGSPKLLRPSSLLGLLFIKTGRHRICDDHGKSRFDMNHPVLYASGKVGVYNIGSLPMAATGTESGIDHRSASITWPPWSA